MTCPCCSLMPYDICCGPLHRGERPASSPHVLMRARFSAFAKENAEYIYETYVKEERENTSVESIRESLRGRVWTKLEIHNASLETPLLGWVEFSAFCTVLGKEYVLRERSAFRKDDEGWCYWNTRSVQQS